VPHSVDRTLKVADLIKTELAQLLLYRAGDPRFHKVTITAVRVSRDLGHAKIFFSTIENNPEELSAVLNKAHAYFRHLLSKNTAMRTVPKLHFVYDVSVSHGQHLAHLIDEAIASDDLAQYKDDPNESK
jgi:ribosome-binding factor A